MKIQRINLHIAQVVLLATLFSTSLARASCGDTDDYLGTVCITAANFCPYGYSSANGQILAISSNSALFSLLGPNYGGDGRTTFALPDLRGRFVIGTGNGDRTGIQTGAEQKTLNDVTLAQHSHNASATVTGGRNVVANVKVPLSTQKGTSAVPINGENQLHTVAKNALSSNPEMMIYGTEDTNSNGSFIKGSGEVDLSSQNLTVNTTASSTGSGIAFNITDPSLGMLYCIATQGPFPPRS